MTNVPAQFSEEQAAIIESWSRAAEAHAARIRAEKADIAAHVDNQRTFTGELATNDPFVNTTADIAQTITGCFADSLDN